MMKVSALLLLSISLVSGSVQDCGYKASDGKWTQEENMESCNAKQGKVALVLGATGETGKVVVESLIKNPSYSKVILVIRRQLELESDKIVQKIVDFDQLEKYEDAWPQVALTILIRLIMFYASRLFFGARWMFAQRQLMMK